ncbi:Oidioi.mRNA.OKI2018_I69.XSR.g15104.t1.cds [Oikopleura dioica]|uniref:Oidioi.mRNA.OKI2018_I69.XSR.g15104.t1.cds n=1 Tax=Oikopleura dioica TaxID=34765 RepID=A0ABN7SGZ0_OIKDI|nr:Oidioi.mRNA.OKI2018_I69.XSR.g15104.t1.cds [Oikopleura dioica]
MSWRLSQRDQKDNFEEILLDEKICFQVLATLYDSRRLDWNDPIEIKRSLLSQNLPVPKKSSSVTLLIFLSFLLLAGGVGGAIKGLQTRITLERRKMLINSYLLSNNHRILRRTALTPAEFGDFV